MLDMRNNALFVLTLAVTDRRPHVQSTVQAVCYGITWHMRQLTNVLSAWKFNCVPKVDYKFSCR